LAAANRAEPLAVAVRAGTTSVAVGGETAFWWPVAANPWRSLFAPERSSVANWRRRNVFGWPVAANLFGGCCSRRNVVGPPLAEKRFWWPVAANLWRLLFAPERRQSPRGGDETFLVAGGGEPLAVTDGGAASESGGATEL